MSEEITRLEQFRRTHNHTYESLGKLLGVRGPTAWRYCLPPDHERHQAPAQSVRARLLKATNGECDMSNFDDLFEASPDNGGVNEQTLA